MAAVEGAVVTAGAVGAEAVAHRVDARAIILAPLGPARIQVHIPLLPSAMSPLSEVPSTSARADLHTSAAAPVARSAVAAVSAVVGVPPAALHTAGSRRVRAILDAAAQYTALEIPAGISGMLSVASAAAAALLLGQAHCSLVITTPVPIIARYGIALACPKDVPMVTPAERT